MFERDYNDPRRVVIVDVMHMFYKYAFGGATQLTATLKIDGVPRVVDTTLPAYTIKQLHRWANYGYNPFVVCFDGRGSTKCRKAYFLNTQDSGGAGEAVGYKESRGMQDSRFYEGINITFNLLLNGGVCCLKADNYEADDLIFAAVQKAKKQYPRLPIDVITGDQDLVPLVDEQVSVFLSSRKTTWAESKSIEKKGYVQLTPENCQVYMEGLTAYKKLFLPYNTVLLAKLLRGDSSDNIPGYPKFTPTKFNNLIDWLDRTGADLGSLFRYDEPVSTICYRGTEEPIPEELIETTPKERKMIKFSEPKVLTEMCKVLGEYFQDEDIINHIRRVYNGINLNAAFTGLPEQFCRRPAIVKADIKGYVESALQTSVADVMINLPRH